MQAVGRSWTVEDLLTEVARDRLWYESSGGGVTVSGGEPLAQPAFTGAFLRACRESGLSTALDTCGHVSPSIFSDILPLVDVLLFDLKHVDEISHRVATGVGLELILTNLRQAARSQCAKRSRPDTCQTRYSWWTFALTMTGNSGLWN